MSPLRRPIIAVIYHTPRHFDLPRSAAPQDVRRHDVMIDVVARRLPRQRHIARVRTRVDIDYALKVGVGRVKPISRALIPMRAADATRVDAPIRYFMFLQRLLLLIDAIYAPRRVASPFGSLRVISGARKRADAMPRLIYGCVIPRASARRRRPQVLMPACAPE